MGKGAENEGFSIEEFFSNIAAATDKFFDDLGWGKAPQKPAKTQQERDADLFAWIDQTKDGQLSSNELSYASLSRAYDIGTHEYELIKGMSFNLSRVGGEDRLVSLQEMEQYQKDKAALPEFMQMADWDGDLEVTYKELMRSYNHGFETYADRNHALDNFYDITTDDFQISHGEWNAYLKDHPVQR